MILDAVVILGTFAIVILAFVYAWKKGYFEDW